MCTKSIIKRIFQSYNSIAKHPKIILQKSFKIQPSRVAGDESINRTPGQSQSFLELVRLDFLELWAEEKVSCWRKIWKFEFLYIFLVLMMFLGITEPESEILLNCPISWKDFQFEQPSLMAFPCLWEMLSNLFNLELLFLCLFFYRSAFLRCFTHHKYLFGSNFEELEGRA